MSATAISAADEFTRDLRRALAVWTRQPLLPLISVLFWTLPVVGSGNDAVYASLLLITVVFIGWPGTEREWYRCAFSGEVFAMSDIWPTSRRYFGPFLRLGLLLMPVVVPLVIAYVAWAESAPVIRVVVLLMMFLAFDVALTFVTPALTFTTTSARNALSIGLTMLRVEWPAAAPYALAPALIVILGAQNIIQPVLGPAAALVGTALAGLVALALKGATVGFYLRRQPTPSG